MLSDGLKAKEREARAQKKREAELVKMGPGLAPKPCKGCPKPKRKRSNK
jgi:hypothetical protein